MKPEEMQAAIIHNLPEKTGRPLETWLALVAASGITDRDALVEWLQAEHGLGSGQAKVLAAEALQVPLYVPPVLEETLAAQYAGAKAPLLPIARAVMELVLTIPDATLEPRKTYVSFNTAQQFGAVGAPNRSAVALDLKLKGVPGAGRLTELPAGRGMSGNLTHRVMLTSVDDVDAEVLSWLLAARDSA